MLGYFFILLFCAIFMYNLLPKNRASITISIHGFGGFLEFLNVLGFVLSVLVLSIVILFDLINNFGARGFIIWLVVIMLLFFSSFLFLKWAKV